MFPVCQLETKGDILVGGCLFCVNWDSGGLDFYDTGGAVTGAWPIALHFANAGAMFPSPMETTSQGPTGVLRMGGVRMAESRQGEGCAAKLIAPEVKVSNILWATRELIERRRRRVEIRLLPCAIEIPVFPPRRAPQLSRFRLRRICIRSKTKMCDTWSPCAGNISGPAHQAIRGPIAFYGRFSPVGRRDAVPPP